MVTLGREHMITHDDDGNDDDDDYSGQRTYDYPEAMAWFAR